MGIHVWSAKDVTEEDIVEVVMDCLEDEWTLNTSERDDLESQDECFKDLLSFDENDVDSLLLEVGDHYEIGFDHDDTVELVRKERLTLKDIVALVKKRLME